MKKIASILAAHALLCASPAPARQQLARQSQPPRQTQQQPTRPAQQQPTPAATDDEVVRITVNLVQLDVVVTDKQGRQVSDLRAEDFEVFEDGRPQQITNFSYVSTGPAAAPSADARPTPAPAGRLAPPVPVRPLRPAQVRRTLALVVDDLNMAMESIVPLKGALRRFVEEQVQEGDLVAVIRTGGDMGALQQFTSDKRQLRAAVERVRWNPCSRRGVHTVAPLRRNIPSMGMTGLGVSPPTFSTPPVPICGARAVGHSLAALRFVVKGMGELPGRKSLVLFTDSLPVEVPQGDVGGASAASLGVEPSAGKIDAMDNRRSFSAPLQRIAELAIRSSVVIYGVDTRGLPTLTISAMDDVGGASGAEINEMLAARSADMFEGRAAASSLAHQTGGLLVTNNNDMRLALRAVMEDQRGYYLIGYRPGAETFDRRFHRLGVRLKGRPDLRVRTRTGFYGMAEEEVRTAPRTDEDRLRLALASPFGSGDIGVRLTAHFNSAPSVGNFVRALLHVDARDLTFADTPDGRHETNVSVGAIAFGDNGQIVEHLRRATKLTLGDDSHARALRQGISYTVDLPLKKAGAYQVRVAVRDEASSRVGSAGQFVEVPDLKKGRLALSGLVVYGGRDATPAADSSRATTAPETDAADDDAPATPARRTFRRGMALDYAYFIFNARPDKQSAHPRLTARTLLFRDGAEVFASGETPVNAIAPQADPSRFVAGGRLQLGADLAPGEYVLQVIVTDALANPKDKHRTTTQWTDFEIIK